MSPTNISADQGSWIKRFADHLHSLRGEQAVSCDAVADSQFAPWGHLDPVDAATLYAQAQCERPVPTSSRLA